MSRLRMACYHITKSSIHVCAIDDTPPYPVCDEDARPVDPATCWARIYAIRPGQWQQRQLL